MSTKKRIALYAVSKQRSDTNSFTTIHDVVPASLLSGSLSSSSSSIAINEIFIRGGDYDGYKKDRTKLSFLPVRFKIASDDYNTLGYLFKEMTPAAMYNTDSDRDSNIPIVKNQKEHLFFMPLDIDTYEFIYPEDWETVKRTFGEETPHPRELLIKRPKR